MDNRDQDKHLVNVALDDCPGPVLKVTPEGWVIRDCDNCILFPCGLWTGRLGE